MIIRYKNYINSYQELPIRWLFEDFYRVIDTKLFLLKTIELGIVFEKIEDNDYESYIYNKDLPEVSE
jgi:hypothetical protein